MNRIAWRFKSELVATALVVALAGVGFVNAQDSASTTLTGQDYEEIKALYARYNQGSDFRDAELFLSAFAEDAVMTRGGGDIVGMDARPPTMISSGYYEDVFVRTINGWRIQHRTLFSYEGTQ